MGTRFYDTHLESRLLFCFVVCAVRRAFGWRQTRWWLHAAIMMVEGKWRRVLQVLFVDLGIFCRWSPWQNL